MFTPMASDHPFQNLFEILGRVPTAHAEPVNRRAYEALTDILSVPLERSGRCILLRAPRAGHGKTHLLSRIQHQLGASYEFIPLQASFGSRIDAASVTDDTLRRLVRQLPASGGLTVLDLVTRRLFASALQPLVGSGEVPCQDREGALTALRARPIETFDFHHPNAVTAHWARENFEVLGQRLSLELAQRADLPVSGVAFWVDALFRFAAAPLENSGRVRTLAESAHGGNGATMERLEALLGLLTLLIRVVLVADDLEGFSSDDGAALKLAAFLGSLRQSVERLDVILSLNQDIWQSAFVPRLSGGLADRLSEVVVELEPLTEAEMAALLDSRVPGLGKRVLERIDPDTAGTHARGLIRAAGVAWIKATAMDSAPAAVAAAPVFTPASIVEQSAFEQAPPSPMPVVPLESVVEPPAPEPAAEFAAPESVSSPSDESPAFTFSPESAPHEEESPPAWPAPVFAPSPPEEIIPDVLEFEGPVEAQIHDPAPTERRQTPPPYLPADHEVPPGNSWAPPVPSDKFPPEPVPSHPPADSPGGYATPPCVPEQPAAAFVPAEWQEPESPFAIPTPPELSVSPITFQPNEDSPFQVVAPEVIPESPGANFTPAGWQQPPLDRSSQVVQDPANPTYGMEPAQGFQPDSAPIFSPPAQPAVETPPPSATDTDRVDDLLRQFRERYGRGSL
jgi:hypothetical protein